MRKYSIWLFPFLDYFLILISFIVSYHLRIQPDQIFYVRDVIYVLEFSEYLEYVFLFSFFWLIGLFFSGIYTRKERFSMADFSSQSLFGISFGFAITTTMIFGQRDIFFSRLIIFYSLVFSYFSLIVSRVIWISSKNILHKKGYLQEKILLVGNIHSRDQESSTLFKFLGFIDKTRIQSFQILGVMSTEKKIININKKIDKNINNFSRKFPSVKYLGDIENISKILDEYTPDTVLLTSEIDYKTQLEIFRIVESKKISFKFVPVPFQVETISRISFSTFKGIPIAFIKPTPLEGWWGVVKRFTDILFASFGLVVLSPVFMILMILIRMESRGPAILAQKRIGYDGRIFTVFKFRSMYSGDNEKIRKNLLKKSKVSNSNSEKLKPKGAFLKLDSSKDPRVTKVGKFLRKTNLDEIPQLFNVLIGNMSLIGPRPYVPMDVEKLPFLKYKRAFVKPGITGLWQATENKDDLNESERIQLDLFYVENWSLTLDLQIFFKTIKIILRAGY